MRVWKGILVHGFIFEIDNILVLQRKTLVRVPIVEGRSVHFSNAWLGVLICLAVLGYVLLYNPVVRRADVISISGHVMTSSSLSRTGTAGVYDFPGR